MSDDFYDREYNPRHLVHNAVEYFVRWRDEAQLARNKVPAKLDVAYGVSDAETLDFFPAKEQCAPLLVFLHGGYWRAMHKNDFSWIAPPYVDQGVSVAIVNYALAPQVGLGEIVEQVRRAIAWIHSNACILDIDPERVVCGGHSAGGHLAAMLLTTQWRLFDQALPSRPVRGVIAASGIFDLEPLMQAEFLSEEIVLSASAIHNLSPANLKPTTQSSLLTVVGELESGEFHRQSNLLAERWGESLVRGPIVVKSANHFDACDAFADKDSAVFQAMLSMCSK